MSRTLMRLLAAVLLFFVAACGSSEPAENADLSPTTTMLPAESSQVVETATRFSEGTETKSTDPAIVCPVPYSYNPDDSVHVQREACFTAFGRRFSQQSSLDMEIATLRMQRQLSYMHYQSVPAELAMKHLASQVCHMPATNIAFWEVANEGYSYVLHKRKRELASEWPRTVNALYMQRCTS